MPNPLNILYVDDDPSLGHLALMVLQKAGYTGHFANSGSKALALISTTKFDAILLDYRMPGMDGLELARAIRALPSNVPIIFISGEEDIPPDAPTLVNACLLKGSGPLVMLETLSRVLGPYSRKKIGM